MGYGSHKPSELIAIFFFRNSTYMSIQLLNSMKILLSIIFSGAKVFERISVLLKESCKNVHEVTSNHL